MKVVGLTGGIASGKSVVSTMFERLGARIVDADKIAREVVAPGAEGWRRIVERFGREILSPDGAVDRERLGAIVFDDARALSDLNAITHPLIGLEIASRIAASIEDGVPLVLVDAALLFESGAKGTYLEEAILVTTDEATQIERVTRRDGLRPEAAKKRIAAQMPLEEKKRLADYIIDNTGPLEETERQVRALWNQLTHRSL